MLINNKIASVFTLAKIYLVKSKRYLSCLSLSKTKGMYNQRYYSLVPKMGGIGQWITPAFISL